MLQATPTAYRGFRFRSRLEARWAVFFDALSLKWDYEAEGFDLPNGERYLPDFWFPPPMGGCWIEIKGEEASAEEKEKCRQLNLLSGRPTYLFSGTITNPPHIGTAWIAGIEQTAWWTVGAANAFVTTQTLGNPRHPQIIRAFGLARGARFQFAKRNTEGTR